MRYTVILVAIYLSMAGASLNFQSSLVDSNVHEINERVQTELVCSEFRWFGGFQIFLCDQVEK